MSLAGQISQGQIAVACRGAVDTRLSVPPSADIRSEACLQRALAAHSSDPTRPTVTVVTLGDVLNSPECVNRDRKGRTVSTLFHGHSKKRIMHIDMGESWHMVKVTEIGF